MANKDHSLDEKIIASAKQEFMLLGFEKASLRKIAKDADVTIGAIYTRYANKDQLFYSLCEPLISGIKEAFSYLSESYRQVSDMRPDDFVETMKEENDTVLHLLFDDYCGAKLLLTKSRGSSLENFFDRIVEAKINETLSFFKLVNVPHPDEDVLKMIISSQFHMYYRIINDGFHKEKAERIMEELMVYHLSGWTALLNIRK